MSMQTTVAKLAHAEKTGDWMELRDAIERVADILRLTHPNDAGIPPLAEKLTGYSAHAKWQVRKSVAHATQHLRHDASESILARLSTDANAYVRDAAQRSRGRRAEAAQSGLLEQQHADLMQKALSDLEAAHGPRARASALRIGKQYAEFLMREAHHEVVRVLAAQDLALTNLEASLARPTLDRDAVLAYTGRARERTKHLGAMFRSLREFAMASSETMQSEDVHGIVAEAVEIVRDGLRKDRPALAERFGARVTIDKNIAVVGHRHRLLQAVRNLVQNAAESYDATPDAAAVVTVTAKATAETVTLTFEDRGCGMSEEAQGEAFHLFSTSKSYGSGIGLALVQSVIESEHHGRVSLVSKKGSGTTITVVLPLDRTARS